MASGENLGARFTIDVTDLKAGLAEANRAIRESESQFREASAGMDDWSQSSEGLTARVNSLNDQVDIQKQKISALVDEKQRIIDTMTAEGASNDEIARAVDAVNKKITSESKQLETLRGNLQSAEKKLNDFEASSDEAGDSADEAGDQAEDAGEQAESSASGWGVLGSALGAVAGACAGAVTAFFGLAESTRESRQMMGQLESAFTDAGLTAEEATSRFTELYGVLGDEGNAQETAGFLAQMAENGADLDEVTRGLTGVYAEFGNTINPSSLAEGILHTSELGEVQGTLADAIEWSGGSVEEFNEALAQCANESERQAYITQFLNDTYGEASDNYQEVNRDLIEANEAQMALTESMNALGAIAEPIMTTLKTLASDLLTQITPFVALIGEGLRGAMEGSAGATDLLAQGIGGLIESAIGVISQMLPTAVSLILTLIPTLIDSLFLALPDLLDFLFNVALPQLLDAITELTPQLITQIMLLIPSLVNHLISAIPQILRASIDLLMGIVQSLPTILSALLSPDGLPSVIRTILSSMSDYYPMLLTGAIDLFMALVNSIGQTIPFLLSALPEIRDSLVSGLSEYASNMADVGGDLIRGLWNGISDMAGWIGDKIESFGEGILEDLQDFFGIHSPSRVMEDRIGRYLGEGIGVGFEESMEGVSRDMQRSLDDAIPSAEASLNVSGNVSGGRGGRTSGGIVINQNVYNRGDSSRQGLYRANQQLMNTIRLARS